MSSSLQKFKPGAACFKNGSFCPAIPLQLVDQTITRPCKWNLCWNHPIHSHLLPKQQFFLKAHWNDGPYLMQWLVIFLFQIDSFFYACFKIVVITWFETLAGRLSKINCISFPSSLHTFLNSSFLLQCIHPTWNTHGEFHLSLCKNCMWSTFAFYFFSHITSMTFVNCISLSILVWNRRR